MRELIDQKMAKMQFALYLFGIIFTVFAYYLPFLSKIAAISFILSFVLLEIALIKAVLYYREIKSKPSEMELMQMNLEVK
jgi:hypothetical protein